MGLDGMMKFCRENKQCFEQVDLVKVASAAQNGITLLVDFNSLAHDLYSILLERLVKYQKNPYLALLNGEYVLFHSYVTQMVESLGSVGINLVWYVDGARGSCSISSKNKLATWKQRLVADVSTMRKMLLLAKRKSLKADDIDFDRLLLPPLLMSVMIDAVRRAGCVVVECVYGDADYAIAKDFKRGKYANAYGILSGDSDFCVFSGSRLLPTEYFDMADCLGLRSDGPHQPKSLSCYVTDAERITKVAQLNSRAQLLDVAILCGNDFTKPFITHEFRQVCRARLHSVTDRATFVVQYGSLKACPAVASELARRGDLREAFEHARAYYELELDPHLSPEQTPRDADETELRFRISSLRYPRVFMSVHKFNVYWSNVVLSDSQLVTKAGKLEPLELVLRPFRHMLYRSLVNEPRTARVDSRFNFLREDEEPTTSHDNAGFKSVRVAEFLFFNLESSTQGDAGRNTMPVWTTVELDGSVPHFSDLDEIDPDANCKLFTGLMNRLVDEYSAHFRSSQCNLQHLNVFQVESKADYCGAGSLRRGFVVFVLKLFLHTNRVANLCVNQDEFKALFCTAFAAGKEETHAAFSKLRVQPTNRSLTIATWFQLVYLHVYQLASLLLLDKHGFPKPHTVFSGAVWTGFCALVHNKMRTSLTDAQMQMLVQTREDVLSKNRRKFLDELVNEYFPTESEAVQNHDV